MLFLYSLSIISWPSQFSSESRNLLHSITETIPLVKFSVYLSKVLTFSDFLLWTTAPQLLSKAMPKALRSNCDLPEMAKSCIWLPRWSGLWSGCTGLLPELGMAAVWLALEGLCPMPKVTALRGLPAWLQASVSHLYSGSLSLLQQINRLFLSHSLPSSCPPSLESGWGLHQNYISTIKTNQLSYCSMYLPCEAPKPLLHWMPSTQENKTHGLWNCFWRVIQFFSCSNMDELKRQEKED